MRVQLDHLQPTAVGSTVMAEAVLEKVEGRRLIFTVTVSDACGLVAAGKVTRVVVTGTGSWRRRGEARGPRRRALPCRSCSPPPRRSAPARRRRAPAPTSTRGTGHLAADRDHRPDPRARPSPCPSSTQPVPAASTAPADGRLDRAGPRSSPARPTTGGPSCDAATLFAVLGAASDAAARHRRPGAVVRAAVGVDGGRGARPGALPRRVQLRGRQRRGGSPASAPRACAPAPRCRPTSSTPSAARPGRPEPAASRRGSRSVGAPWNARENAGGQARLEDRGYTSWGSVTTLTR